MTFVAPQEIRWDELTELHVVKRLGQIVERRNDVRRLSANTSNLLNTSADIRVQVTDRIVSCGDAPIGDQSDNAPLSRIGLHKGVEDTDLARRTCRYLRAIDTATKISAC